MYQTMLGTCDSYTSMHDLILVINTSGIDSIYKVEKVVFFLATELP